MSQPLLPWESEDTRHPQLVWRDKLDNRYLIEVRRIAGYRGTLYVFDHQRDDQEIFCWEVGLSFGAWFGPADTTDVQEWEEKVLDFIDNTYRE